jgi:biotin carboxyl carrier protein
MLLKSFIFTHKLYKTMKHLLKAKVNDVYEFEFEQEQIQNLDIQKTPNGSHHLLVNNKSVTSEIVTSDFLNRTYTVKINSNLYQVQISNKLDVLIKEMGLSLSANQIINEVKAPMPGMILDVMVKVGQDVKEGDNLLVLEAMKMENTIMAPRDAVIKSIHVKKGKTVSKNEVLIEME